MNVFEEEKIAQGIGNYIRRCLDQWFAATQMVQAAIRVFGNRPGLLVFGCRGICTRPRYQMLV